RPGWPRGPRPVGPQGRPLLFLGTKRDLHVAASIQVLLRGVAQRRRRETIEERPRVEDVGDILAVFDARHQLVEQVRIFLKANFEVALERVARTRELTLRRALFDELANLLPRRRREIGDALRVAPEAAGAVILCSEK